MRKEMRRQAKTERPEAETGQNRRKRKKIGGDRW